MPWTSRGLRLIRVARLGTLAGLACGCAVGPDYRAPTLDVPAQYSALAAASAAVPLSSPADPTPEMATWWKSLHDPMLDSLVERAVKANLNIEIALERLDEARVYEAGVVSEALPRIDATGAAARGTGTDLTRGRAEQGLVSADNSSGLQHVSAIGGFEAVWELDIFGEYRREFQAVRADAQAAMAARNAVLVSVIADVVRAYVDLRGLQVRDAILHKASDVLRESLRIVEIRYQRGITNELDAALAARELAAYEAQIAPVEAQIRAAQSAIAVLLGSYPESLAADLSKPQAIPSMPPAIATGSPPDLLRRRPDIVQAERELAAATARVGVATAALFPQVTLIGALGAQQQTWGAPQVGKHLWSFGPGATWPVLDFGALDAQVERADFETRARLAAYRQTILTAVNEVDTAVDAYTAEQRRLDALNDAMVAAQRAVDLATERYNRGLTDFLNVVDAERQYYDLQEEYDAAQVAQADELIRLYKSLGGGWENYQSVPAIRRPQPAVAAAVRSLWAR